MYWSMFIYISTEMWLVIQIFTLNMDVERLECGQYLLLDYLFIVI